MCHSFLTHCSEMGKTWGRSQKGLYSTNGGHWLDVCIQAILDLSLYNIPDSTFLAFRDEIPENIQSATSGLKTFTVVPVIGELGVGWAAFFKRWVLVCSSYRGLCFSLLNLLTSIVIPVSGMMLKILLSFSAFGDDLLLLFFRVVLSVTPL